MTESFVIRIELLDNGYTVEVPDVAKITKKKAEDRKKGYSSSYYGDCTEKKVAKTTNEVLSLVKESLANLPETVYADAFDEASKMHTTKG